MKVPRIGLAAAKYIVRERRLRDRMYAISSRCACGCLSYPPSLGMSLTGGACPNCGRRMAPLNPSLVWWPK